MEIYIVNSQEIEVSGNIASYHDELFYGSGEVVVPVEDVESFKVWLSQYATENIWVNGNKFSAIFEIGELVKVAE